MKFKMIISWAIVASLFAACSSKKTEDRDLEERKHDDIARDYTVSDASSPQRPGWIEDAEIWAKNNEKDMDQHRFFSFETDPKVGREIACNLAKTNARSDIAAEIAAFIDKRLGTSVEGQAGIDENNPHMKALREFTENTLAEKVSALVHGAAVVKTYWEKRQYKADLGAKQDYVAFTCAVLVRMENKRLAKAIDEAANHVLKNTDDAATKENVKKALENVSEEFIKAKTGQI